jgi:hypothetical protein
VPPGTNDYTPGTYVQLNATDPVIIGSTKYIFSYWDIDGAGSYANPLQWVYMDAYHNATAHYTVQYLVTLTPNPVVAQGVTDWMWSAATGWLQTNSMWVANGANCEVGVEGLIPNSPDGVYVNPSVWAYLINFSGAAAMNGYNTYSFPPEIWYSNPFTVTGPCTAGSNWAYQYLLLVSSNSNPPPNPSGTGWYNAGTNVTLTAPDYSLNFYVYRYTLAYWTVDGVTTPGNPIFVIMNTNHTAIAYYKRQSFVYLDDNIGNFSGIKDNGKWYDDAVVYTFNAPTPLSVGSGVQYDFRYWDKPGYGWTNTSNPLHLVFDSTWDGETLRGRWQTQYKLIVFKSPSTVSGFLYPDSDNTGWFDAMSTVNLKALPIVTVDANTHYLFLDWKDHLGGTYGVGNLSFVIWQPVNMTAEYKLQYLLKWKASPMSISVTGFPGQQWWDNGTWVTYVAPSTDVGGTFAFKEWTINSYTYNQLNTTIPLFVTGPVDGTATYANMTKITMDPGTIPKVSPAYCTRFNVTIAATNFDANRLVGGQPMDIYGFEFRIQWDNTLLDVTNVYLNLDAFFAPNAYFIAKNEVGPGYLLLAATVKGNYTGFSGTKAIVTIEFHIIKDACYPQVLGTGIYFQVLQLSNHLGNSIWPELNYNNAWYQISAVQPQLEIRNAADGSNVVTVRKNVPVSYFDVEVFLHDGVKVHDFYVQVVYNPSHILAESVVIGNYLKAPYVIYHWDTSVAGLVIVQVVQDNSVALQNGSGVLFTIHFKVVGTGTMIWTTANPGPLSSFISINYAYLSVMCPTPAYQDTLPYGNGNLGVLSNCQYNYNPLPGDLNFDGVVNVQDLQLIADNYHTTAYDIVVNGDTDLYDLVFVALRFGNHV